MEPFPANAVAVEWEFRCHTTESSSGRGWEWRCKSKEGMVIAKSNGRFRTLREALEDASRKGFTNAAQGDSGTRAAVRMP